MKKYLVLKTCKMSPDGSTVIIYREGDVVEIPDEIAEIALSERWIEAEVKKAAPKNKTK